MLGSAACSLEGARARTRRSGDRMRIDFWGMGTKREVSASALMLTESIHYREAINSQAE